MMMVTGGRLASQVDGLQAATLSLTKRVVNMNSALEQVSVLDSKLELLDLGHASQSIVMVRLDSLTLINGVFWH